MTNDCPCLFATTSDTSSIQSQPVPQNRWSTPSHEFLILFTTMHHCPSPPQAPLRPSFVSPLPFHLLAPALLATCPHLFFDLTLALAVGPLTVTFLDVQLEVRVFKVSRGAVLQFLVFLSILRWYVFFLLFDQHMPFSSLFLLMVLFLLCSCGQFYYYSFA